MNFAINSKMLIVVYKDPDEVVKQNEMKELEASSEAEINIETDTLYIVEFINLENKEVTDSVTMKTRLKGFPVFVDSCLARK